MIIKSNLPGRVRIQDTQLYRNEELSQVMNLFIKTIPGIQACHVNPVIGTLVIEYDGTALNVELICEKIEQMLTVDRSHLQSIQQYYREYFVDELRLRQARRRMFFFGGLYLLFRIKTWAYGKSPLAKNVPVLKIAATITIVTGYPLLRRGLHWINRYFPTNVDRILLLVGAGLMFAREGSKGVLILFLKAWTDSLKAVSDLQIKKVMLESNSNPFALVWLHSNEGKPSLVPLQSLQPGDQVCFDVKEPVLVEGNVESGEAEVNCMFWNGQPEIRTVRKGDTISTGMILVSGRIQVRVEQLPDLQPKTGDLLEDLEIYEKMVRYQENVIYLATGMGLINYLVTGQIPGLLAVLLVMTPTAVELALNSGLANYLKLLLKHNIVLRNLNIIEKIRNARHIAFDKTGTLTVVRSIDTPHGRELQEDLVSGAGEAIARLKLMGLDKITILSGDAAEHVARVAGQLEIEEYYSGQSPEDKEVFIRDHRYTGPLIMVGDGVNDLRAMKYADVSITFHDASGPAVMQADCILMEHCLKLVPKLLELTEQSYGKIEQNLRSGQIYNLAYGLLGMIGKLTLFQAQSLHALNAIFSTVNSCRISGVDSSTVCQVLYPFVATHPAKWNAQKTAAFLTGHFDAILPAE